MINRIGGVLLRPNRTLFSILRGDGGSMFDLLPWVLVLPCALSPNRAGQAILYLRANVMDGLQIYVSLIVSKLSTPVGAAIIGALLLSVLARIKLRTDDSSVAKLWTFDRCLDACMYMLVPFFVLCSLGIIFESVGVASRYLPHRPIRGRGIYLSIRLVLAFGWSLALYLYVLNSMWHSKQTVEEEA